MSELNEKTKIESVAHPAIREYDNTKTLIVRTGSKRGAVNRFEIIWMVPTTDEEAKERYNCSLSDLIENGVQIISHAPDYATIFNGKDEYTPELHTELQNMADNYKVGTKRIGAGAKTKAEAAVGRAVQDKAKAFGYESVEEMFEALQKIKKAKK